MPVHRRITALLATLTTLAGGSFVTSAVADTDTDGGERGARSALQSTPHAHATAHRRHAQDLAGALGVSDDRLALVLRELRVERRGSDVTGARPAVRTAAQLAEDRAAYASALAEKVGVAHDVAVAALDGGSARTSADPASARTSADRASARTSTDPATTRPTTVAAADGPAAVPPTTVRPPSAPGT